MKHLLFIIIVSLSNLTAQESVSITGVVKDSNSGEVLIGANVVVKGTSSGTATDVNGLYSINVAKGEITLECNYIGYKISSQKINSNLQTEINFTLNRDILNADAVVVTGMVGERNITKTPFSIGIVTKDQIESVSHTSAETAIRGKIPGVRIVKANGQPGSSASVQLRGATSINATGRSQDPLYIVDGVILNEKASLADIDASNISNVEVVKGAAAASLYGARAAQGVINITTSRGNDIPYNSTQVIIRTELGTNDLPNKMAMVQNHSWLQSDSVYTDSSGVNVTIGDYINSSGYWVDPRDPQGERAVEYFAPDSVSGIAFQDNNYKYVETGVPESGNPELLSSGGFNHMDRFFNPGNYQSSSVSIAHNTPTTNFFTSFNKSNESGILYNLEGNTRNSFRVNIDHSLADKLQLSTSTYFSQSKSDEIGQQVGSPFFDLAFMNPSIDLLKVDTSNYELGALAGQWNPTYDQIFIRTDPMNPEQDNPLYALLYQQRERMRNRFLTNANLSYMPFSWLALSSNISMDLSETDYTQYYPKGYKTTQGGSLGLGYLGKDVTSTEATNSDFTASISKSFGEVDLRAKTRYLYEKDVYEFLQAEGSQFSVGNLPSLDVATEGKSISSSTTEIISEGYFFILGADVSDKYIADIMLRKDGSSLFGSNERWHNYYRMSFAYRISEEAFWAPMKNMMNEFKLRFSQGTAGNRPDFAAQYETYAVSGGFVSKKNLGNKDLKPELATETEVGIDATILDRFTVQLTSASSTIEDQILQVPLNGPMGFSNQWQNAGTLESSTIEMGLQALLFQTNDITWTANLNYDKSTQIIKEFDLPSYTWAPEGTQDLTVFWNREGETLGTLYGDKIIADGSDLPDYVVSNDFQINDDGYLVWVGPGNSYTDGISKILWGTSDAYYNDDSTLSSSYDWGMPIFTSEKAVIGTTVPDYNYAFSTNFKYKAFSFYMLFEGQKGGSIYNLTKQWAMRDHTASEVDQADETDENKKPTLYYDKLYNVAKPTSHFVEDGTYLKLQELSVRYNLNLTKYGLGNRLTVALTGRNLLCWTEYSGFDPEVGIAGSAGGSAVLTRFDGYSYPNFRSYALLLELEL